MQTSGDDNPSPEDLEAARKKIKGVFNWLIPIIGVAMGYLISKLIS